jgi:hypothetical protein
MMGTAKRARQVLRGDRGDVHVWPFLITMGTVLVGSAAVVAFSLLRHQSFAYRLVVLAAVIGGFRRARTAQHRRRLDRRAGDRVAAIAHWTGKCGLSRLSSLDVEQRPKRSRPCVVACTEASPSSRPGSERRTGSPIT